MSENVQIATLVCSVVTTLGVPLIGVLIAYLRLRLAQVEAKVDAAKKQSDGMKDELVKATAAAAFLSGKEAGIDSVIRSPGPSRLDPTKPASDRPST